MPKQFLNINNFSGGINDNADPRDLKDNELSKCQGFNVSHGGKVDLISSFRKGDFDDFGGTTMHDYSPGGRGLFVFKSDYPDAEDGAATGSAASKEDVDYLLAANLNSGAIHCYSSKDSAWGTNTIVDLGTSVKPSFYSHKGAFRVADANHTEANTTKWYGYVKTIWNKGSYGANVDQWVSNDQKLTVPTAGAYASGNNEVPTAGTVSIIKYHSVPGGYGALGVGANIPAKTFAIPMTYSDDLYVDASGGWNQGGTVDSYGDVVDIYKFYASFDYGDLGESPLVEITSTFGSSMGTQTNKRLVGSFTFDHTTKLDDLRIKGVKIYYSQNRTSTSINESIRYLLLHASFEKGLSVAGSTEYKAWKVDSTYNDLYQAFDISDPPTVDTYESENGYTNDEITTSTGTMVETKWKTACVANGRVYIGNVEQDNIAYSDSIFVSPVGSSDVFPKSREIVIAGNDGDSIVHLEEYADRILQFKKEKLQILNISQDVEFLEDTYHHRGVRTPAAVCKTDFGVAWANLNGVYLYDGAKVHALLEKEGKRVISDSTWESFITGGGTSDAYDGKPAVGYLPKTRRLVIIDSVKYNNNSSAYFKGEMFIYDFIQQSWINTDDYYAKRHVRTNGAAATVSSMSNLVNWTDSKLIYAASLTPNSGSGTVGRIEFFDEGQGIHSDDNTSSANTFFCNLSTKDYDFGSPGIRKKVYAVRISYKGDASAVKITYGVNGTNPYTSFATTSGGSANTTPLDNAGTTDWDHKALYPTTDDVNNLYSFRLRIYNGNNISTDFEINDITIIYRVKTVL